MAGQGRYRVLECCSAGNRVLFDQPSDGAGVACDRTSKGSTRPRLAGSEQLKIDFLLLRDSVLFPS